MTKYNLQFLEEKLGPFQKEHQYSTKPISGFNLIYIETKTKKELNDAVKKIKDEMNPGYIWGYVKNTKSTYVTRAFGENKIFIYNPEVFKNRTDYVKGKLKVLNKLTSDNINDLFDQKAVFDYFYKKLWDLRLELGKEIRNKNGISDNKALMAAQNIIDRVLFTYFVCEKDLVTLNGQTPLDSKTLFDSIAKMPDPWSCLKTLFFEQFAKNNSKPLLLGKNAQIIAPYLNGGLFRPKEIEGTSEIDLEIGYTREQWQELFEPLNKYTWIIEDELTDPEGEYEGNLTPEILGHIYEKFVISISELDEINLDRLKITRTGQLYKGNKKIGAYYTPENITRFICEKTIYSFINDKINSHFSTNYHDLINELLKKKNLDSEEIKYINHLYFNVLSDLKICDNACGSGAFLIAAQETLFRLYFLCIERLTGSKYFENELDKINKHNHPNYYIKKKIITNNLYGIDIKEGAVEIAKLRLWLSMVSEITPGTSIEPLPNIDFNILVGNSLVGYIKIPEKWTTLDDPNKIKKLMERRQRLINSYRINDSSKGSDEVENEIKTINNAIKTKLDNYYLNKLRSQEIDVDMGSLKTLKVFHWGFEFYDIFYEKKEKGFDILIGNPPYFRLSTLKDPYKAILKKDFKYYEKESNAFAAFLDRSNKLIYDKSYFSYITHKNLLNLDSYSNLRKQIIENNKIVLLADCKKNVFVGVTAETVIFVFCKQYADDIEFLKRKDNEFLSMGKIHPKDYRNFIKTWNYRFIIYTPHNIEIINSFPNEFLGDKFKASRGIETGNNSRFVSNSKKGSNWHPVIRGKHIQRYYITNFDYLEYSKDLSHPLDKELINQEKIVTQQNAMFPTVFYDKGEYYVLNSGTLILPIKKTDSKLIKFILLLLNSKLIQYIFMTIFTNRSTLTINILPNNLELIPLIIPKSLEVYLKLADYMNYLNETEDRRIKYEKLIQFIDDNIIDSLIYELYFKNQDLQLDRSLEESLSDYITHEADIDIDTIINIQKRILNDENIINQISCIKNNMWVKIVENCL